MPISIVTAELLTADGFLKSFASMRCPRTFSIRMLLLVVTATTPFLAVLGQGRGERSGVRSRSSRLSLRLKSFLAKFDEPIEFRVPKGTPLGDVLKYTRCSTQGPNDKGIPIFIDPDQLAKDGNTVCTTKNLFIKGVPLKKSLPRVLTLHNLVYVVNDDGIWIGPVGAEDADQARWKEIPLIDNWVWVELQRQWDQATGK